MNVDTIHGFMKRKPFKAILIKTSDGDTHSVTHVESVAISPENDLIILWPAEGGMHLLDAEQITKASYPSTIKTKSER